MHKTGGKPQEAFGKEQVLRFCVVLGHGYVNLCHPVATTVPPRGRDHVLVSDRVSNITSLSYMSHSRVNESRSGVSSIILS